MNDISSKLTTWVTTFEDVLHIVSGPFLAAGALIATSFVFTDGAIGKGAIGTSLLIFWSITQAIGLDFQVLSLGYKSVNAARAGDWRVCTLLVLLAAVLGFVGVQTHAVFGYVSSNASSITVAMHAMGIDQRILLWERAGLSFLLTFIAGAMRPAKQLDVEPVLAPSAVAVIQDQLLGLEKKIEEMPAPVQQLPAVAESKLQEMLSKIEHLSVQVDATLSTPAMQVSNLGSSMNTDGEIVAFPLPQRHAVFDAPIQSVDRPLDSLDSQLDRQTIQVSSGIQGTREAAIRAALAEEPGLSANAIARKIGCSVTTASVWKKKIEAADV